MSKLHATDQSPVVQLSTRLAILWVPELGARTRTTWLVNCHILCCLHQSAWTCVAYCLNLRPPIKHKSCCLQGRLAVCLGDPLLLLSVQF
jgi:hypothetical protein